MKKIVLLILVLLMSGCIKKEFTFKEIKDYLFVVENKENIEKIVLKTDTEKCYLLNTEETFKFLDNINTLEEATEYITDSNFYIMVHFNDNIDKKYYFEKQKLYEEKIVKSFRFEGENLIHSGKKYKIESAPIFFTNKDEVPSDINEGDNTLIIAERQIECDVLKQVVREY